MRSFRRWLGSSESQSRTEFVSTVVNQSFTIACWPLALATSSEHFHGNVLAKSMLARSEPPNQAMKLTVAVGARSLAKSLGGEVKDLLEPEP